MKVEKPLLRELKRAYRLYIEGDVASFDQTLATITLSFAGDAHKVMERIRGELGEKEG